MLRTTGIFIEHDMQGVPTFARIDLKKYGAEFRDFFSAKGISVDDSPYNPEFVAKIRKSREQIRNGEYRTIKTENLWK